MPTILDVLGTSTPVSEVLAEKLGYVRAAIACRVFFYQQLGDGCCRASTRTLAKKLGMGQGTVCSNLKWLVDNEFILELGKHKRGNVSNRYVVTDKFYAELKPSSDEERQRSSPERSAGQRSGDERNVREMNVNVREMNGEEESKEELKETTTNAILAEIDQKCKTHFSDPDKDEAFKEDLQEQIIKHNASTVLSAINLALSPDRANGRPKNWGYVKAILNNPDKKPKHSNGAKNGHNGNGKTAIEDAYFDIETGENVYPDGKRVPA